MSYPRWVAFAVMAAIPCACGEASVLNWITRLGHTNCDNHPVRGRHSFGHVGRPDQHDIDDPLYFRPSAPSPATPR